MKIKEFLIPEQTIEEFADDHNLVMELHERPSEIMHKMDISRYYASFSHAEIKKGSMLCSAPGNGDTKEDAISAYASIISEQRLIINATKPNRKEINVPRLITKEE